MHRQGRYRSEWILISFAGGASRARDVATQDLGLDGQQHSSESIERQQAEESTPEGHQQEPHEIDEGQHEGHEDDDNEETLPYPEPHPNSPLIPPPPADFKPFFTLIESSSSAADPSSENYHHPTVHYVFADDDPEILTAAALESLDSNPEQADNPSSTAENERFVILDLSPSGKEVVSATSLSPDWQALRISISPAPSWGGSSDGKGEAERGLMLRISGQEAKKGKGGKAKQRDRVDAEGLLRGFDELMTGLDGVLGEERQGGAEVDIDTQNAQTARERVHEIDSI